MSRAAQWATEWAPDWMSGQEADAEPTESADDGPEHPASSLRLPPGRRIELGERGTSFYRDIAGPPGAPTLLLLHGWTASGGLNWFQTFDALSKHFRIIAPDLRGHGRGIRSWRRFSLRDCADDVAQLLRQIDVGPVIAAGYSMGGPVAQLLWLRHPKLVSGLVLCATSHHMVAGAREKFVFTTYMSALAGTIRLGSLAAHLPRSLVESWMPAMRTRRPNSLARWAAAEMARHDVRMLVEAGYAIGRYDASAWIGQVNVPTAVLAHLRDAAMSPESQLHLAEMIPDAKLIKLDAGHIACGDPSYAKPLLQACRNVAKRIAKK